MSLTIAEVAVLADVPKRLVDKAIEEGVLTARSVAGSGGRRRLLPLHAVAYVATIGALPLKLNGEQKGRIEAALSGLTAADISAVEMELAPGLTLKVGPLLGDRAARAERYVRDRDAFITRDPLVIGGEPVIRGTRISVQSVWGQVRGGDSIDMIAEDNYDVPKAAFEAASIYGEALSLAVRSRDMQTQAA